jgi:hypothetical protein
VVHVTRAIAEHFTDPVVKIDAALTNAGRILRMPGTINLKGPGSPERPHRQASIIHAPATPAIIPLARLEGIAALASPDPARAPSRSARTGPYMGPAFDLDTWLEAHAERLPPMSAWEKWRTHDGIGKKRHFLKRCPFNTAHEANNAAFIAVRPNGAIVAGCLHDRCRHWTWHDLRALIEDTEIVIEV